jgi:hypothetical protein
MLHLVRVQQCDELFDGVGGVADGEEDVERHSLIVLRVVEQVRRLRSGLQVLCLAFVLAHS